MFRTKPSFGDLLAALAVLLVAVLLLWHPWRTRDAGKTVVIVTPDQTFEYALSEDTAFQIESRGITLFVTIMDGEVDVYKSDCSDGVCVNSAPISKTGETIVCAPAGVSITVKGGDGDVDHVAG